MPNLIYLTDATGVTFADFQPVLDSLTGTITVSGVVATMAGVLGAAVGFVFMWWGLRKLSRVMMSAFKSGKLKF